ncbi:MAG: preprotein translocase subunit YajC, partial [Acutalibacteraceae bacterium]
MRDNLEIGDEITTIGGIMGRVVSIKEETDSFVIETGADRVKMQFKRWALSTIDTVKDTPKKETETKKKGFFGRSKD